jgi:hypothetical protein
MNTQLLLERNNNLAGTVVTDFATRWSVVLLSTQIVAEGREGS